MKVVYSPEDGDRQEWDFDPERVRMGEAQAIERQFGQNYAAFTSDVQSGNAKARHVLLWHLMRRQHPKLRYEDVPDFYMSELTVEHTVAELTALRARAMKAAGLTDEERDDLLAALDNEISNREAGDESGKD